MSSSEERLARLEAAVAGTMLGVLWRREFRLAEELWYGAAIFERDDPLFLQIAAVVGYDTDEKLDQFFAAASER